MKHCTGCDTINNNFDTRCSGCAAVLELVPRIEDSLADSDRQRFKITEFMGEGSFGIVYRAFDSKLNKVVALKILKPDCIGNGIIRDLFKRECVFSSNIGEEHLVTTLDFVISDHHVYSIMEFIDGIDLNFYLSGLPALGLQAFRHIAEQLASGLYFFHYHELLHCDLKPANIMINPETFKLKIIDLGLSHFKYQENVLDKEMVAGTHGYMSPEQEAGSKALSPASDIYSIGAICYELLTGSLPVTDGEGKVIPPSANFELGISVPDDQEGQADDDSELEAKIRMTIGAIDTVVMTCLEQNPKNRFKDTMEFRHALRHVEVPAKGEVRIIRSLSDPPAEEAPTDKTGIKTQKKEKAKSGTSLVATKVLGKPQSGPATSRTSLMPSASRQGAPAAEANRQSARGAQDNPPRQAAQQPAKAAQQPQQKPSAQPSSQPAKSTQQAAQNRQPATPSRQQASGGAAQLKAAPAPSNEDAGDSKKLYDMVAAAAIAIAAIAYYIFFR